MFSSLSGLLNLVPFSYFTTVGSYVFVDHPKKAAGLPEQHLPSQPFLTATL